jgi:hypothetical protein
LEDEIIKKDQVTKNVPKKKEIARKKKNED